MMIEYYIRTYRSMEKGDIKCIGCSLCRVKKECMDRPTLPYCKEWLMDEIGTSWIFEGELPDDVDDLEYLMVIFHAYNIKKREILQAIYIMKMEKAVEGGKMDEISEIDRFLDPYGDLELEFTSYCKYIFEYTRRDPKIQLIAEGDQDDIHKVKSRMSLRELLRVLTPISIEIKDAEDRTVVEMRW